jgi:hypothetical protein
MRASSHHLSDDQLDRSIRVYVYRYFAETGQAPSSTRVAQELDQPVPIVEDAYKRLAAGKAIALAPGTSNIWMAHPFSAVPTPYRVRTHRGSYWANCAWDALNIPALLNVDAQTDARCPDCNTELSLVVRSGNLQSTEGVIHFVVPPRRFWENIGFT